MPKLSDIPTKDFWGNKKSRPWRDEKYNSTKPNIVPLEVPQKKAPALLEDIILEKEKSHNNITPTLLPSPVGVESLKCTENQQSYDKLNLNNNTILDNISDNKLDNISDNKLDNKYALDNKSDNISDNKLDSKLDNKNQDKKRILDNTLGDKLDNKIIKSILPKLKGHGALVFCYILKICSRNGELETGPISTSDLAYCIGCSYGIAKTTIERLEKRGIIVRHKGRTSSHGYINLGISKEVKKIGIEMGLDNTIDDILDNREKQVLGNTLGNKLDNKTFLSSSNNINTTTGESKYQKINLEDDWLNVNIEPLESIGFSKNHLGQIASQNILTPEILQNSIDAFAFDLAENNKSKDLKSSPINFFMGILRNGQPYVAPPNYENPKDKAMRLYLEELRKREEARAAREKEIFDMEFKAWFVTLTDEEKKHFMPANMKYRPDHKGMEAMAEKHFTEKIWGKKLDNILKQKD